MFTYSPQEKIIVAFIKRTPFKSVLIKVLNAVLLHNFFIFIVVHESFVCPIFHSRCFPSGSFLSGSFLSGQNIDRWSLTNVSVFKERM